MHLAQLAAGYPVRTTPGPLADGDAGAVFHCFNLAAFLKMQCRAAEENGSRVEIESGSIADFAQERNFV